LISAVFFCLSSVSPELFVDSCPVRAKEFWGREMRADSWDPWPEDSAISNAKKNGEEDLVCLLILVTFLDFIADTI
jgi:hypothetical protein